MARTRATKGRPRPPSRNTIARVDPKRGSTVESLRASITSIELDENEVEKTHVPLTKRQTPCATGCLRYMSEEEENIVNIKQEEDDMAGVTKVATRPKRRTQGPISKASATKKHKPSLPSSTTRTTRSKTLTSRTKPGSIHSDTGINTDNESENDFNTGHNTITNTVSHQKNAKMPLINPSLDLLRPYMAFQLSVSGLSGKAYKAAQASMASVLDMAERLEKRGSRTLARAHDTLGSSSSSSSGDKCDIRMGRANRAAGKEKKVEKLARRTEEDALPRKQRELNEQARKRLEQEMRKGRGWQGQSGDRDSTPRPSSISTSSSDAATEIASDTEDEAKYPPGKLLSVSSTTSSYHSLHRSTDSAETSSEGEESDVIERREKNALRRQKARQKRRNMCKRVEHDSKSGSEMEMDVVRQRESERRTAMLATRELGWEVMVDFLPVAW